MRIKINSDETKLSLRLPNMIIKSRLAARVMGKNFGNTAEYKQLREWLVSAYKILSAQRKKYGRLTLVDIQTHDGDVVKIEF